MKFFLVTIFIVQNICSLAQDSTMTFEKYNPLSTLIVPEHQILRAKYPFVDIHSHQWEMPVQDLSALVSIMDKMNMAVMNNLSGGSGDFLKKSLQNVNASNYSNRLILFSNIDFKGIGNANWTERTVKQLEEDIRRGAKGLKIFENLGTFIVDDKGMRVTVDDPRLDPIWKKCGELGVPVLIHTGAPIAFWSPFDEKNERWLELNLYPQRRRTSNFPSFEELIKEQHRMFKKHSKTIFIAAHFDWHANNLAKLDTFLTEIPNVYIEFGAVIAEIGRQPRMARQFFIKNQDRILFGKDSWVPEEYVTYFRVLETNDEYFRYHKKYHAFWNLYGIELPDDVLKKIYYKNALRIIKGLDRTLFPNN
jgi:predicted TIM-barrel fold metal-dependent hydrolase